ncbi:MAG: hypothetical protein ABSG84_02325 [Acidobacteriaceae bacterium]|jgi:hypothetical protein
MIQARALEPTPDLCCLPSPYRIPQGVAGMAFNFSKIELSHHPSQRKAPRQAKAQPRSASASASRA